MANDDDAGRTVSWLAFGRLSSGAPARQVDRLAAGAQGLFIVVVLTGAAALAVWASQASIDQVTRAPGTIVVARQTQTIQHLEGGIIADILTDEGDRVVEGQPLLRITDSRWIADRAQAVLELDARRATRARLLAEALGADAPAFPDDLIGADAAEAEAALFAERRAGLQAQTDVLQEQIRRQILELAELRGRRAQIDAEREIASEQAEIFGGLVGSGAISRRDHLTALAELQRIDTRISDLSFQIPQVEAQLDETRGRLREAESAFRQAARQSLSDIALEIATLDEQIASFDDRDARALVRSPVAGVVNQLLVSTIGGVVREGQAIAEIVPTTDEIVIDARLRPEDRGDVWPGMPAIVKVTAYDFGMYGGVEATVAEISPDALRDEDGGSYFRVRLTATADSLGPDRPILPGMSVDVDLISGRRTVLALLTAPVQRIADDAFRQ